MPDENTQTSRKNIKHTVLKDGETLNPAPVWRRSLMESAMRRPTTRLDRILVPLVGVLLAAGLVVLLVVMTFALIKMVNAS